MSNDGQIKPKKEAQRKNPLSLSVKSPVTDDKQIVETTGMMKYTTD